MNAMQPYEYDFPSAILYSGSNLDTAISGNLPKYTCASFSLEWTIGYPRDHSVIPETIVLEQDQTFGKAFMQSASENVPTLFKREDGVLPEQLFCNAEKRAFGDPVRVLIVIPLKMNDDIISGFLVVGLNTRRPFDTEYQEFVQIFSNLLNTTIASITLYEDESRSRKRALEQAAMDREVLNAEVAVLTQEASEINARLHSMKDVVNKVGVGFFEYDMDGKLVYANVRTRFLLTFQVLLTMQ